MPRKSSSTAQNTLVQATVLKKCDRTWHKPDSNKGGAAGTCQHTCEPAQVADCAHKWTVRYSVSSQQREQSFGTLTEAQTFQLTLSTGKQTQGAMFTDPRAGIVDFLPLCAAYIDCMARAGARTKAINRSNFANPAVAKLLRGRSVLEVILDIALRDWDGKPAQPAMFLEWHRRFTQAFNIPDALAQSLAEDLGLATSDDPPALAGYG